MRKSLQERRDDRCAGRTQGAAQAPGKANVGSSTRSRSSQRCSIDEDQQRESRATHQVARRFHLISNRRGYAFLEYFILALIIMLATVMFFSNGDFGGSRGSIEAAFQNAVQRVAP